jgi:hypothetical protein
LYPLPLLRPLPPLSAAGRRRSGAHSKSCPSGAATKAATTAADGQRHGHPASNNEVRSRLPNSAANFLDRFIQYRTTASTPLPGSGPLSHRLRPKLRLFCTGVGRPEQQKWRRPVRQSDELYRARLGRLHQFGSFAGSDYTHRPTPIHHPEYRVPTHLIATNAAKAMAFTRLKEKSGAITEMNAVTSASYRHPVRGTWPSCGHRPFHGVTARAHLLHAPGGSHMIADLASGMVRPCLPLPGDNLTSNCFACI